MKAVKKKTPSDFDGICEYRLSKGTPLDVWCRAVFTTITCLWKFCLFAIRVRIPVFRMALVFSSHPAKEQV